MTKEKLKPLITIVLKQLMARQCVTFKELKDKKDIDEELENALNDALTLILGYIQDEPEIHVYPTIPQPTMPQEPWYTTSVSTEPVKGCEVTSKNK